MKRAIIVPTALADAALAELKHWLAITTTRDDEFLIALLHAALDTCEAFTGIMPLETGCEEVMRAHRDWQRIATSPVVAITGVEALAVDGSRMALPVHAYLIDITAEGCGRVRLTGAVAQTRIVVRSMPAWRPIGPACPTGCVTASSAWPPTSIANVTKVRPATGRLLRSLPCGNPGAGCASHDEGNHAPLRGHRPAAGRARPRRG